VDLFLTIMLRAANQVLPSARVYYSVELRQNTFNIMVNAEEELANQIVTTKIAEAQGASLEEAVKFLFQRFEDWKKFQKVTESSN